MKTPKLSVVVIAYDIPRELPRTLLSLGSGYQRYIDPDDYEVIVVDNGSSVPVEAKFIENLPGNFRLIRIDDALPSPARALNRGIAEARGDVVGAMIDGARIATPGLLHFALGGSHLHRTAVVVTMGWYVGFDFQTFASGSGSPREREDALLGTIAWPEDGYRLFEVGTMDESSVDGWFQPMAESNALFLRRESWDAIGGFDERFDVPGGGLLNLDTFARALELPDAELVVLLGEATFHQWHGGVSTNAQPEDQDGNWRRWAAQYEANRGRPYAVPQRSGLPTYVGTLPSRALARFARAAIAPGAHGFRPPLGPGFRSDLWAFDIPAASQDAAIARLVDLARDEFVNGRLAGSCAVARLIHGRNPYEPGVREMLALVAPSVSSSGPHPAQRTEYHIALGEAHRILRDDALSREHYKAALAIDPDLPRAHLGLAALRMPGESYLAVLERIYRALQPETAVEIGIFQGNSLTLFEPPTIAIGVDPNGTMVVPPKTETHLFAETSDAFFAAGRYEALLGKRPLSVGFIDGLHLFEQALKDFIGLEALCGPRSIILMHDTVPLDEPTQTRARDTIFHTGDVWKVLLCLKHYRPDLDIKTIVAPPTGLSVITGLDPTSRVLSDRFDEVIERYVDTPFSTIAATAGEDLNIVTNDWSAVESHLRERGIL